MCVCVCVCVCGAVVTAPLQLATQFGPFLEDNGEREEREEREGREKERERGGEREILISHACCQWACNNLSHFTTTIYIIILSPISKKPHSQPSSTTAFHFWQNGSTWWILKSG